MLKIDAAWTAGFFDGEGSIYVNKSKDYYQLQVKIAQIDKKPLVKVKNLFGGNVCKTKRGVYYWSLGNEKAIEFLKQITKFLVSKNDEAKIAVGYEKLLKRKGQYKLTSNQIKNREEIYQTLKLMKKRKYGRS